MTEPAVARPHRARELRLVAPDRQTEWLADQVDEVDVAVASELALLRQQFAEESLAVRQEVAGVRKVLTGLLVSIIGLLITAGLTLIITVILPGKP